MRTREEIDTEYVESLLELRNLAAQGCTAADISRDLGITPGAVRQRAIKEGITLSRADSPCRCHGRKANARELGHRFGLSLRCKCGATWDAQQAEPTRCVLAGRRGTG